jgi:hypothetical protein
MSGLVTLRGEGNSRDDFVICCRGTATQVMTAMREMMQRLRLTVNEERTRQCRVWDEGIDSPGYTIGRCHSPKTGKARLTEQEGIRLSEAG